MKKLDDSCFTLCLKCKCDETTLCGVIHTVLPLLTSLLSPHLAVELGLLPLHLTHLGLEPLVLIGQHVEPVLEGGALLLVAANQLAMDLVLEHSRVYMLKLSST